MSKKAGIFVFALCLVVSNILLGLVLTEVGQAQEIHGQPAVDKSMQLFQLQMAELQNMHRLTSKAPPNLIGDWKGTAPKLTSTGDDCSTDIVLVTIAIQCGNLMNGTIKVDTNTAIPVVGSCYNGRILLQGYVISGSGYKNVFLVGNYATTPSPRIKVQSFSYVDSSVSQNFLYDHFILVKQ